jgi:hypothetical protein
MVTMRNGIPHPAHYFVPAQWRCPSMSRMNGMQWRGLHVLFCTLTGTLEAEQGGFLANNEAAHGLLGARSEERGSVCIVQRTALESFIPGSTILRRTLTAVLQLVCIYNSSDLSHGHPSPSYFLPLNRAHSPPWTTASPSSIVLP